MNYQEAEEYINSIPRFSKMKSEKNVDEILEIFGHPELSFSYIHVAGTNGKGSVCAFLDSMLRAAGKKVGLFTSPHLITTAERIKVDGANISEEDFASVFNELYDIVKKRELQRKPHPTYFEWLYLMAMIWFKRCGIEYGVIETGLGGRLDATNHISEPVLTIITSISYDHMEILGDTLAEIAGEKAGIIKENVPVICDGSEKEALQVIEAQVYRLHAPIQVVKPENIKILSNKSKNIDFLLHGLYDKDWQIRLHTEATYQTMNSSLAWAAMQTLKMKDTTLASVSDDVLLNGIEKMQWPGRMEEILPNVYIDGAHNVGGITKLTESLMQGFKDRQIWLVFAVANDKEYDEMIAILCKMPMLNGVIVTELDNSRKTDLETVAKIFAKNWNGYVGHSYNINEAIIEGERRAAASSRGMLVCAGSLYLAGSVMEALQEEKND